MGWATASLLVGKLQSFRRQNALMRALQEHGRLVKSIHLVRCLDSPECRKKIGGQLNKGESLHALKRDLLYAHEGTIRARHLEQQTEQAWCLWSPTRWFRGPPSTTGWRWSRYVGPGAASTATCWPTSPQHSENINFFGSIDVDIEGEFAQLGPTGYRPLRVRDTLF